MVLMKLDDNNLHQYTEFSNYMKTKIRKHIVASRTWITTYYDKSMPCQLCPQGRRIVSRTLLEYSFALINDGICYKCIAKLHVRREREQPEMERALHIRGY